MRLFLKVTFLFISTFVCFAAASFVFNNCLGIRSLNPYLVFISMGLGLIINLAVGKQKITYLGFRDNKSFYVNLSTFFIFAFMTILAEYIVFYIINMLQKGHTCFFAFEWFHIGFANMLANILQWFIVGICEEAFFRGYLYQILRDKLGFAIAAVISSIIFTSIHVINPEYTLSAFLITFFIALFMCYIYYKTENLWNVIGYHFAFNLFQDIMVSNKGLIINGVIEAITILCILALSFVLINLIFRFNNRLRIS